MWGRERVREGERERGGERESGSEGEGEREHMHEGERERLRVLLLHVFFPPPGPALWKLGLARSAVCST